MKTALRNALMKELKKRAQSKPFGEFIQETLFGKAAGELFRTLRQIAPLKRVEIRKTELKEVFDTPEIQTLPKDQPPVEEKTEEAAEKAEAEADTAKPAEETETAPESTPA